MTANLIQPSPEGLHWYALKVFYNRVVYLRSLFPEDVETYTPMQTVEQYERGQLSYVEKQLIPSLLFVRCSEDWLVKFKHEHNADFMYYAEPESSRPGAIPDSEMRSFILVTSADAGRDVKYFGADAVIAVDINSGMNGDTGEGQLAVVSDLTVSIGYYKTGMFRGSAGELIGEMTNVDIGIRL